MLMEKEGLVTSPLDLDLSGVHSLGTSRGSGWGEVGWVVDSNQLDGQAAEFLPSNQH